VGEDTKRAFTARAAASRAFCGRWACGAGGCDKESISRGRLQACLLHAVRCALQKVRKVDRAAVAEALKRRRRAANKEEAKRALEDFISKYAKLYPKAVKLWAENFDKLTTFLHYPPPIRKQSAPQICWRGYLKSLKGDLK